MLTSVILGVGKKEALSFLRSNNKSILKAWESYKQQVGTSDNPQLNSVFEQMFKAWILSNKKAIRLLENRKAKKSGKSMPSADKKPESKPVEK